MLHSKMSNGMYEHTLNYLADVRRKNNFIELYHTLSPEDAMAVNDAGVQTGRMYGKREACKKDGGAALCLLFFHGGGGGIHGRFSGLTNTCVPPPPLFLFILPLAYR